MDKEICNEIKFLDLSWVVLKIVFKLMGFLVFGVVCLCFW